MKYSDILTDFLVFQQSLFTQKKNDNTIYIGLVQNGKETHKRWFTEAEVEYCLLANVAVTVYKIHPP